MIPGSRHVRPVGAGRGHVGARLPGGAPDAAAAALLLLRVRLLRRQHARRLDNHGVVLLSAERGV